MMAILFSLLVFVFTSGPCLVNCLQSTATGINAKTQVSGTRQYLFNKASTGVKVTIPKDFEIPEPKPLTVADGNYGNALTGSLGLALRLGAGVFVAGWQPTASATSSSATNSDAGADTSAGNWPGTLGVFKDGSSLVETFKRPTSPIIIYEYEGSPFCRKVRDACVHLDLTVEYRPCPIARYGWSDDLAERTDGKRTVPFMIDPNAPKGSPAEGMFESDDIINYLFETYGNNSPIPFQLKGVFSVLSAGFAALARGYAGSKPFTNGEGGVCSVYDLSKLKALTLYGYEASPFVKPVREALCSLGLKHVMVNCGRGSMNRNKLYAKTGTFQVPYLEDPNTGIEMFESSDIVK